MYFGSTKNEWIVMVFLLCIALIFSIVMWRKKKNFLLGFFLFSALSNLIFYIDSGSDFFYFYHLKWIVKLTLWYWPWINLGLLVWLIINFIRNKRKNRLEK